MEAIQTRFEKKNPNPISAYPNSNLGYATGSGVLFDVDLTLFDISNMS